MIERITVTVAEEYADRTADVAARLRDAGMTVERVLGAVSMVTGTVESDRRPALEAIGGVASVETERLYQLPDPGSGLQ
ncbi:hypothetical protein GCM10009596_01250 [Arthrobacter rhombi]|uniref:hypothetical protein n=1 Tax=Arthrobacter rhombi TaxID=71253 RepID=UPI0031D8DF11